MAHVDITIDYNNDRVKITHDEDKTETIIDKPKTMKDLEKLIYELINFLENPYDIITLHRVDEDSQTIIEEW